MKKIYFSIQHHLLACLVLLFLAQGVFAQNRTITGKVTDAKTGEGISGVTVTVRGTTIGSATSGDGSFSISVPANAKTLIFSSVGYGTQEIAAGSANNISVALQYGTKSLDEVVVVGYGTQRRGEVTSATATVKPEDFRSGGARNPLDLIQGKVAGLTITRTSNNPNSGAAIILRGATSLQGSNSPLIVIDGIPGGNLDLLQQDDIASIDVLKDGSAAAIYGTRANGGVILVTTKKGREGPARFDYATYFRKESLSSRPEFLNASEYRAKIAEGVIGTNFDLGSSDDMYDALLNKENLSQYHNLALSGGSGKTNYRVSMFYQDLQGIAKQSGRANYGGRLSISQKGFNDRLSAQVNVATNFNRANLLGNGINWETALTRNPTAPIYKPDGTFAEDATTANPLARLSQETSWRTQQTTSLDAKMTLDIYEGLSASVFGSLQRNTYVDDQYRLLASRSSVLDLGGGGYAYKGSFLENNYAFEPTINYNKNIADKHVITALAGYSYQYNVGSSFNASNVGFLNDIFQENNLNAGTGLNANATFRAGMGSSKEDNKLIAFFGRANYAFNGKYLATFIIRREGSSRFGANNKWGNFPAASVGWNISRENFMSSVRFINNLKLRAGYGITGNQGFANYSSLTTLSTGNTYLYPDGVWRQTYGPDRNPNPDLRWEKKKELNLGVDFAFLGNRLTGAIDVYRRNTVDLLGTFDTQLPGFVRETVLANVGTIQNNGVELTLSAMVLKRGKFNWDMDLAASHATSKLTKFNAVGFRGNPQTFGDIPGAGALGRAVRTAEGDVIGNFYGKKFAGFAPNGTWLFYKRDGKTTVPFNQINTSNDQSVTDLAVIGNGIPKYYASWTNSFRYGNLDLRLFLRGKFGFNILNVNELGYGTRAVLPGNVLRSTFTRNADLRDTYQYSDYYIEKGDYVKVDEITLGYNFNLNSSYIRNLRIYATGQNLATFTKYTGNDPDFINDVFSNDQGQAPGMDSRGPYPRTRSYLIGLNVGF
ncbi:SusC/RagA family TonB-linked outer membrane protein [Segetibacter sp. 3557_3]|uniref:SusC/RagA family TonB-linked outer membrane protein n=1 Tax=Segetibacter sp. 3557_3 TaxID=2547429 RepID=UPI001058BDBB|nr:SusC/RagA family TonB-linked outer membrane protein [Segetibacter sp. 3557_3]TDH28594.1 SusC/RagA family TonB-linked outer membrane protein [Segetibacter sp. 3557_3]